MNGSQDRPLPGGPVLAHRNSALRISLAVVAALEAGAALAIVPAWTPGRAAFAGVALGLGALAALTAVVLMGTGRPIGNALRIVLAIAIGGGWWGSTSASMLADPTQARIPDLELSVTCTVSPDLQSVVARAEFRWQRLDLGPGLAAAPGTDSLQLLPDLPEFLLPDLAAPQPEYGPPRLIGAGGGSLYWSVEFAPESLTLDGRPSQRWVGSVPTESDPIVAPDLPGTSSALWVSFANGNLRANARYGATWTFLRNSDAPQPTLEQLLPIFVVEYRHLDRFTVQAFGSCGDSSRSWPKRSIEWNLY